MENKRKSFSDETKRLLELTTLLDVNAGSAKLVADELLKKTEALIIDNASLVVAKTPDSKV